ncbi:ATP-binding cassette domain-containing protein [Agrobacterium salinitolerans]|uniref:ATP-binding cassette domain-containing protein n=2 Tax=Rhizobium/Agrobacterium group TaxID=227290 RepID=A0ABY3BMR9_9HYPH|nr:ATP-binding cassette domain-containing protein [Agrobacterium salinitolerans]
MIAPSPQVSSATNDGVQMPHCTRPDEVSGGELQRLAIARFLLFKPICLVADEPTSRLDPLVQRQTIELLRDLVDEQRMSLLLTSHDLRLVRAVADDVVQLG